MSEENIKFYEDKITEELIKFPFHDRYVHCDSFSNFCADIGKEYNRNISILDCMRLWEKFRDKKWDDGAKWEDSDGDCICEECQNYKKEKKEEAINYLLKYPDSLEEDVYIERCKKYGLIPNLEDRLLKKNGLIAR